MFDLYIFRPDLYLETFLQFSMQWPTKFTSIDDCK